MIIELQASPAKSMPREHFVVKRIGVSLFVNSETAVFPLFCSSLNLSWVIILSRSSFLSSSSVGKSLKAETWTRVGGFAREVIMSSIFR